MKDWISSLAAIVAFVLVGTSIAFVLALLVGYPINLGQAFVLAWGLPLLKLCPGVLISTYNRGIAVAQQQEAQRQMNENIRRVREAATGESPDISHLN